MLLVETWSWHGRNQDLSRDQGLNLEECFLERLSNKIPVIVNRVIRVELWINARTDNSSQRICRVEKERTHSSQRGKGPKTFIILWGKDN